MDHPHNGVRIKLDPDDKTIIRSWSLPSHTAESRANPAGEDAVSNAELDIASGEKDLPVISTAPDGKVRPRVPPIFLLLPWPFNYVSRRVTCLHPALMSQLLGLLLPILIPFVLLYA